jgi:hypothetical protein
MKHLELAILLPTIALALVVLTVWFILMQQRLHHVATHKPKAANFADGESVARYFRPVERPAQNLANLFEMPVLYFALVPLLLLTGQASVVQVGLAWSFVALRALHSLIHIGPNNVQKRFRLYLASCIALSAMWLGFGIDLFILSGAGA